jgi:hypothetical protein
MVLGLFSRRVPRSRCIGAEFVGFFVDAGQIVDEGEQVC